ncbi:permease [Salinicoccus albus]|uniref:permease n=1 Tax=Salinicoccus albus TaxID=418756 RepID=UPI0003A71951|nr:permease [Salinicoccus albus]
MATFICLYLWNERNSLLAEAESVSLSVNFWDLTLRGVSDVYLIVYLMFPLYLFKIGYQLTVSFDYTQLIRFKSYGQWIINQMKGFALFNLLILSLWNICSLLVSIGLPFSGQWSEFSALEKSGNEILFVYNHIFSMPVIAWLLQFLLFFMTLMVIQLSTAILYTVSKRKWALNSFLVLLMLISILSFQVIPASFSFISLPNYLSLFHGIESFSSPVTPFLVLFIVLGIGCLLLPFIGRNFQSVQVLVKDHWAGGLFVGMIGFTIISNALQYENEAMTAVDLWILSFFGTTNEEFSLLSFSFYIIAFMGFVYFVQLFLHEQIVKMSYMSIIRYESLTKWFLASFNPIIRKLILFLLLLSGFIAIVAFCFGYPFPLQSNLYPESSMGIIAYHFFVNGFLQVTFYILLVVLISIVTMDVMKSFITLLALSIFMLPKLNLSYLFPVGLNSMGLLGASQSIFLHTSVLLAYALLTLTVLAYILNKKDFSL